MKTNPFASQLILQNTKVPNDFLRLFVEFEVEEDDITILRGKKTMRQTVLHNNSTSIASFDDAQSLNFPNPGKMDPNLGKSNT